MWKKILAGALALSLLAGCGFREVYEDIFGAGEDPAVTQPRELTSLAIPVNINDSLSPYAAQSDMNQSIVPLIFDGLFLTDGQFEHHAVLAAGITGEGREYTVTLREDVRFSDGSPLTAADVVYSYQQTETQARRYWQLHTSVESVQAVDDHTVRVTAYRADRNIAGLLSFPIVRDGADSSTLTGTGRYTYREEHGRRYLTVNEQNPSAPEKIREIELVALPNDSTVANALRSGVIDCMYTDFSQESDYGLGSSSFPIQSGNVVYIGYSSSHPLLAQRAFRSLMGDMVSRESIASDVYYNKAAAAYTPFPDSYYDLPDEVDRTRQSDDIIGMELELMGVTMTGDGTRSYQDQPVELGILVNSENPFRIRVAETVARYLGYYGIAATVEPVEYESYLARLASGDYDLFIAEVCVGENLDISPLISGSSLGIAGDCSDAQLLEQYYAYCAGSLSCGEFLEEFRQVCTVTPLVYRHSGVVVSPAFPAEMTPVSRDIFYNMQEW
ncbi:MAG: hypothetical protein KH009_09395 [Clostridiales bacterium]|nr:hypothetical protein [Clostridiales bacterium]